MSTCCERNEVHGVEKTSSKFSEMAGDVCPRHHASTDMLRTLTFVLTASVASISLQPPFTGSSSRCPRAPVATLCAAASTSAADIPPPTLFGDLPLPSALAAPLHKAGIKVPTDIQAASSMPINRGGHVLLHSETGSGKTYAYLLPLLARLHVSRPNQLIIMVPSRELALQTAAVVEQAWPHHGTRRAYVLAGTPPPAQAAESVRKAACPVLICTPRPILAMVKHLGGTDRLHSRRALASSGEALTTLTAKLRAIVLDETDALLLDRELALGGPPKRKSYSEISGGGGTVKAPERFTKPTAKAVQALLKARSAAGRADPASRGGRGRGGRGRGGRGGRGGGGRGGREAGVQLVACSATASYRLREELCRLFEIDRESDLQVISPSDARTPTKGKRSTGERGLAGVGVPTTIIHSWVSCAHEGEKPAAVRAAIETLKPRCAFVFLADDAPLRATVTALREAGLDATMLHEAMGLDSDTDAGAGGGELNADGYSALRASLTGDGDEGSGCRLLVSTESSARGLDLGSGVECVLLYSLPQSADSYLHLAGRTGRQGRRGSVVSLLGTDESGDVGRITRQLGLSIKQDAAIALALDDARRAGGE